MTCNGIAQRDTAAASAQWSDAGHRWAACGGREEQPRACCGSGAVILSHGGMRQLLASICSIFQQLAFALYAWHAHAWLKRPCVVREVRTEQSCDVLEHASLSNAVVARIA